MLVLLATLGDQTTIPFLFWRSPHYPVATGSPSLSRRGGELGANEFVE